MKGCTKEQNAAIEAFKKKFHTDTHTEVDFSAGITTPLTNEQIKKLNDLGWLMSKMCRA